MNLRTTRRWLLAWGTAPLLLSACAQTPPACVPGAGAALQVLVRFHPPAPEDAAQTLQQLQRFSQGCVQAVASVSPTIGVFRFTGVDGLPLLRQRLLAWPQVQDVQPDAQVRQPVQP